MGNYQKSVEQNLDHGNIEIKINETKANMQSSMV
jgi:hypothetical protein